MKNLIMAVMLVISGVSFANEQKNTKEATKQEAAVAVETKSATDSSETQADKEQTKELKVAEK